MKFLLTILAAFLCAGVHATNIRIGPFTNSVGGFDTNQVALYQISGPIRADGGYTTKGLPIIVSMTNNGVATNFLMPDNWFATNRFLGQGILFGGFPYDSGPTVYAMADWQISGGNTFVTRVITNGGAGSVTFNNVTNALGYTPPQGSVLTNFINTNSINGTNFSFLIGLGLTNLVNTNSINLSNDVSSASTALTNLVNTNGINGTNLTLLIGLGNTNLTLSAGLGLTNLIYTNGINGSNLTLRVGQNLTNLIYTNGINLTNLVNTNSINLTNLILSIGSNSTNNDMTLSNAVYRAGTNAPSSQSAFNATNGMQNGAFMDTNGFKVTITNIATSVASSGGIFIASSGGFGTNNFFTNAISISGTNASFLNSTSGIAAITNLLIRGGTDFSGAAISNSGHIVFQRTAKIIQSGDGGNTLSANSANDGFILFGRNNQIGGSSPQTGVAIINSFGSGNATSSQIWDVILGGTNMQMANASYSVAIGGANQTNRADYSATMGDFSVVPQGDIHSFVWSDGYNTNGFAATGTNQFLISSYGGIGLNTNAPVSKQVSINGDLILNGTNLFSAIQSASSSVQTNNFTPLVFTNVNQVVYQSGSGTNISHFGFMSIGGGLTYIISTNVLGVTNCAYTNVNGTYNNYATAGAWTNIFDARWTLAFGAPNNYSFRSNGIIIYLGGSAFVGTNYAAQGTAAVPTPIVYIGGYVNPYGFIKNPTDVLQGTNDPNGIIIAPKGSHYQHFTGNRPDYILVNTNDLSGWY